MEFDLEHFNKGNFFESIKDRQGAEQITQVCSLLLFFVFCCFFGCFVCPVSRWRRGVCVCVLIVAGVKRFFACFFFVFVCLFVCLWWWWYDVCVGLVASVERCMLPFCSHLVR
jgi:hypothetical protein